MSQLLRRSAALLAALGLVVAAAAPAAAGNAAGYRTQSRFIDVVDGPASDQHIAIDTTLYIPAGASAAHPVPAVIGAHGFGENKQALAGIAGFLAGRGYAVLLYSARGFGRSGGKVSLDSPFYDVEDVEQLVSWLGTQPEIERDSAGPVAGMLGESYGGATTLLAAAYDPAIRVAIPILTWNSLISSFLPNDVSASNPQPGVFKQGWASVFLGGGGGSLGGGSNRAPPSSSCPGFVPAICQAYVAIADSGPTGTQAPPAALAIMAASSPAGVISDIKVPTLLIQGEADTLFDLNEAETTEAGVRANGAPARMVWVPGGHSNLGAILSGSTASVLEHAILSWLDRWLKGDRAVTTGGDTFYDPGTGRYLPFAATAATAAFGLSANGQLVARGARAGALGFANPPGGQPDALSQDPASELLSTVPPFDIPGQHASFTSPPLATAIEVVGSPTVRLTVSSSTPDLELFVKLYDVASDTTASLPGGQVAPIRLTGLSPGVTQTVTVTLPAIVQRIPSGDRLRLVVAATDAAYTNLTGATIYRLSVGGDAAALALPTQPLPPRSGHTAAYAIVAVIVVAAAGVIVLTRRRPAPAPIVDASEPALPGQRNAVVIAHLSKQFRGVKAVDDLSLTIGPGQVFGLLGPNGAGKTTTIRMLLGLVYPSGGSSAIFGETIRPGHPVLARVGTLVEGPKFVPHLSGIENLRLFWRAGGQPVASAHIEQALEVAGLGDAVHRAVKTYSQGMRQRLGIAQAMLGQPELMILDEPTNGLDPQQMFEMRQVIRGLAERGITVLISSHLLGEVEQVCTHVAIMDRGRLVAAGTVAELIAGSPTVYVEVDDAESAVALLEGIGPVRREGAGLVIELNGTEPAAVARALVGAGISLSAMSPRRHLEDVFIGLIEDERGHPRGDPLIVELAKQVRRLRTRLGLGAMIALPAILAFVFWLGRNQGPPGAPQDIFALATQSGLNFAAAALEAMGMFFLVVVVSLFAGEPVAGEANWGTLRYLLVRPVTRARLLRDKLAVAILLGTVAVVLVPLAAMAAGTIAFGWGRMQIPFGSLSVGQALIKLAIGTGYEVLSLSAIATLAFMLSTMTSAPAGPVAIAVGAAIVSQILDAIPSLGSVAKWLPTHYWGAWTELLSPTPQSGDMVRGMLAQVPYVVIFGLIAWLWFQRKDILS